MKWKQKSDIRSWDTWSWKTTIIIVTLKGLLFYTIAFLWRFQKILKFPQRQISISLHMKITFQVFYYFDNVLHVDGLHIYCLKHITRNSNIYYWKLGTIQDTVNFQCTVKVTVKIHWNLIIQLKLYYSQLK